MGLMGLMGGQIEVRSVPGRGSSFTFEIAWPVFDPAVRPGPGPSAPNEPTIDFTGTPLTP
jgi:hypothetical protein